jgi:bifunctional oligoribonuclease and PAP phosphatase NrnA
MDGPAAGGGGGAGLAPETPDWEAAVEALRGACRTGGTVGLIAHVNPDSDSLGSAVGLGLALREMGARPFVSFDAEPFHLPESLAFLPGQDLLVAPDMLPEPLPIVVTLDVGSPGRLGRLAARLETAGTAVVVDHHRSGVPFGTTRVVDPDAASTSVVVAELLTRLEYDPTPEVATALYAGLVTDTGSFRQAATNPAAHLLAARLIAAGADPTSVGWSVWGMHGFAYVRLLGDVLGRARLDAAAAGGLGLAWTVITRADFVAHGLDIEHVEGAIDVLWGVRQAEVAAILKQTADGTYMVSLRSRGRVDVGALAAALGGGGHREKAGFDARGEVTDIVAAIAEQLDRAVDPSR